jgi:uncharacterized protein
MVDNFEQNGELLHVWKQGKARIAAKLDDYAYLIQAMLQLAAASGENKWVAKAAAFAEVVLAEFSHDDGFFYYTARRQAGIPVRKVDTYDGATPSANAVMAHNLWIIGMCLGQGALVGRAKRMWLNMSDVALRYSYSFGYWAMLLQRDVRGMKTLVCANPAAAAIRRQVLAKYWPQGYLVTSDKKISELPIFEKKYFAGEMHIFVCSENACLSPVSTVSEAFSLQNQ